MCVAVQQWEKITVAQKLVLSLRKSLFVGNIATRRINMFNLLHSFIVYGEDEVRS